MSHHVFFKHFRGLLNSNSQRELPPDSIEIGSLDYNITLKELKNASALLKAGKAVGIGTISNEMASCLIEKYPQIVLSYLILYRHVMK